MYINQAHTVFVVTVHVALSNNYIRVDFLWETFIF